MNSRVLAVVAALALGLVLLMWFLRSGSGTDARGTGPARVGSTPAQSTEAEAAAELAATPALSEPQAGDETRRAEAPASDARRFAPEEGRQLDLRLVAPAGTPFEERAVVLALAKSDAYDELYGKDGPVDALRAGKTGRELRGLLASAELARDGTARLALPPDADEAWLIVAGLYLYSHEAQRVEPPASGAPAKAVELRPVLGAWISGRLRAPAGTAPEALAGTEVELDWSINAALQLGTAGRQDLDLATESDAAGRFEFRAVPVGKPQTLATRSSLARVFSADLAPAAGEHLEVELALHAGGSVSGRVVDEQGVPIEGAEVEALGREFFGNPTADLREQKSAADGRFELTGLTPGKVWLHVEHEGHQELLSTPFELADGERRNHGDVVLSEGLVVAGTVTFPGGAPAASTRVTVEPDLSENLAGSPVDPRAFIGASNDAAADATGAFRITGLGKGPWIVAARLEVPPGDGARAAGRWGTSQALVRPSITDLRLALEPPVTVAGRVLDGQGRPVAAFTVHGERAGSQWYMPPSEKKEQAFESADGRFVLPDLRAGSWSFRAEAAGYARSAKVARELPSDEELALVLLRPVVVAGTVVDPTGTPVAGAEVTKELEGIEAIQAMQGRSDWPVAQSDGEGAFRLEGIPPGAGSLVARKDGFAPSAAVALELAEGEEKLDLVLTLRRGGTITGQVYGADGKPATGSMVILQMPTLEQRRFTNTDGSGAFEEHGLKPGTWQVQAFPGIESLQSEDGEALDQAKLLAVLKMTSVTLEDGAEEHVVLGAPPEDPVRVHGRVTLAGEPVPGAVLSFVPANGKGLDNLKIKTLDAEGRYALELDAPGEFLVTVQNASTPGRQNSIEFRRTVPKAAETQLDLELPLGRITGRVRDSGGEPVAGARVTVTMQGGLVFGTVFGGHYTEAATDERGAYEVPWLRPGSYTVAAGGAFMGGAFGDGEALGRVVRSVELGENEAKDGVDFRLELPGTVRGTVRDAAGNLVAEASIFLRDEEGRLVELFSLASTNASGSFEYPGLAPGEYTLTARTRALASAAAVPVRVRSGEKSDVTVTLEPGTILLVSLEDSSGADIPSRVSVLDDKGRELNGMMGLAELMERYSGGLGESVQRVGPLPPGSYEVHAIAADGRSVKRPVELTGQAERKLKLRLK
ncbi:MAG TPA: carboxypeptidase regulatory-like domain-containing protein [Planctomycetota bacterium]